MQSNLKTRECEAALMHANNDPDAIRLINQGANEALDHQPNHLLAKIPNPEALRGRPDPVILMRLEAAIAKERKAYLAEMSKDVQRLIDALRNHTRPSELWPIAHELRCMAGTFAHPFLTQVAQVLCALIKKHQTSSALPPDEADVFAHALQRARHHKGPMEAKEDAVIQGLRKIAAQHFSGSF
jgi:hypothetical protein